MNWDHPIHSFTDPNVEPQTPTRTPTISSLDDTAFQTPKFESSFYDPRVTWDTADPYASSPELTRSAHRFDQTPGQRVQSPGDGTISRHRPVDIGRADSNFTTHSAGFADSVGSAKRSAASMQTPPPTSTVRRKAQDRNSTNLDLSTPIQPTYSAQPLETPSRVIGFSPGIFGLQGSPDFFTMSGNLATASPYFSRQMPWGHEGTGSQGAVGMSPTYGGSFNLPASSPPGLFDASRVESTNLGTSLLPVVHEPNGFNARSMAHDACGLEASHATLHSSIATSPRVPPVHSEDPSMFLSSPARRFGYSEQTLSPPPRPRVETRQPYHYQTELSEREKTQELKKLHRSKSSSRRQKVSRVESASYAPQTAAGKPAVKRSVTHSGVPSLSNSRPQRQTSFQAAVPVIGGGGVQEDSIQRPFLAFETTSLSALSLPYGFFAGSNGIVGPEDIPRMDWPLQK
ncbi:predicted protein [Uncinocarpus reesii 1704]|uniref:Uncharacterized protein n=1 Tax=Uncinocarpus reesii (strain UAMH 1704) TaxID=336963 RepID=C4JIS2_UNCRE|nr:uncharacterized protein UREG_02933 [Uncinocarpus reesii 1704]EEP78084.1 predicted protein [Uncinocarpus reesii 1704]